MGRKLLVLSLAFTLLAHSPLAVAQETTGQPEWSAIRAVPFGDELVIEMKDGKTVKGKLSVVSDRTLTLSRNNRTTDLDLLNVRRAYRVVGESRGAKSALMGAGIGAAAGAAIGVGVDYALSDGHGTAPYAALVMGSLGAGIGATVGAIFGRKSKRILIYEAK